MFTYFIKLCVEITALANHRLLARVCCQTMTKSILQTGNADMPLWKLLKLVLCFFIRIKKIVANYFF